MPLTDKQVESALRLYQTLSKYLHSDKGRELIKYNPYRYKRIMELTERSYQRWRSMNHQYHDQITPGWRYYYHSV